MMRELRDYIEMQKSTGMSDIEIITSYFIDNDIEEEAMELSHNLVKAKIEKTKHRQSIIKTWAYASPSAYLYQKYSVRTATMLHRVELDYIVNGEVTGQRLEWAKDNFPTMKMPKVYFMPCVDWLAGRGIKFKEEQQ